MKKVIAIFLTLVTSVFLCSCIDNDLRIAQEKFEEILDAIQSENKDELTSLFSDDSLNKARAFDAAAEELFEYFEGVVESYDYVGPFVETTKENNQVVQIMEFSCEVKTTKCEYRIAFQYIIRDTENADRVGVQSLYVIKAKDDINLEYAYWGDSRFLPGINIAIQNAE